MSDEPKLTVDECRVLNALLPFRLPLDERTIEAIASKVGLKPHVTRLTLERLASRTPPLARLEIGEAPYWWTTSETGDAVDDDC
jgi:hypothetical protein